MVAFIQLATTADFDDVLAEMHTDDEGKFHLDGSTRELTPIDPVIKIYHRCYSTIFEVCATRKRQCAATTTGQSVSIQTPVRGRLRLHQRRGVQLRHTATDARSWSEGNRLYSLNGEMNYARWF